MKFYLESAEDVIREVGSSPDGISDAEAAARLEKNGKNKLDEGKKDSLLKRFFNQLKDPMIIMLIVAAATAASTRPEMPVGRSFPMKSGSMLSFFGIVTSSSPGLER